MSHLPTAKRPFCLNCRGSLGIRKYSVFFTSHSKTALSILKILINMDFKIECYTNYDAKIKHYQIAVSVDVEKPTENYYFKPVV